MEPTESGARVTVSWTAAPGGLASAMLVRETLPAGAEASVSSVGASGSSLSAVRREGSVWAFLVPRASALKAGSFSYEVAFDSESELPVSGVWRGMTAAGASVSGAVGGAAALPGRPPAGGGAGSGVVPGEFAIRAFSVESAEGSTRASFAWTGSGAATVEIQWTPSLAAGAAPAAKKVGAETSEDGWTTVATVVPGETSGLVVTRSKRSTEDSAGAEGGGEETVYRYSVETDARAGFFRLVVPESGSGPSK